jgi:hypothetical protein
VDKLPELMVGDTYETRGKWWDGTPQVAKIVRVVSPELYRVEFKNPDNSRYVYREDILTRVVHRPTPSGLVRIWPEVEG